MLRAELFYSTASSSISFYHIPPNFSQIYNKNEGIVHFAIRVLGNLAFGNDDNRARIGQIVLDDVLRAMKLYPQNVELQQHAMITLTNCSHGNDANKRLIASKGGFNR